MKVRGAAAISITLVFFSSTKNATKAVAQNTFYILHNSRAPLCGKCNNSKFSQKLKLLNYTTRCCTMLRHSFLERKAKSSMPSSAAVSACTNSIYVKKCSCVRHDFYVRPVFNSKINKKSVNKTRSRAFQWVSSSALR